MSPAYYWRADGGYQKSPEEQQSYTPTPFYQPNMCFCQGYGPGYGLGYRPNFAPWMMPQTRFMQGLIPIAGLGSPPPYAPFGEAPHACAPPLPAAPAAEKKKEDKKEEKKENPWAPPKLPSGANFLFDGEHTILHVFYKAAPIWEEKYRNQKLKFKIFKVGVNFTVKLVIERTLKKSSSDCKGWAATEAVERGDGQWDKGTTIEYDNDKSNGTLKSMGWTGKRGDSLPPVWLVVHKVDFK